MDAFKRVKKGSRERSKRASDAIVASQPLAASLTAMPSHLLRVLQVLDSDRVEDHQCPRLAAVSRHMAKKCLVDRALKRLTLPRRMFPVVVGASPLHGRGVFATRDIAEGELLTLYPPDGLAYFQGGRVQCISDADDEHETFMMRFYAQQLSQTVQLLGDPDQDQDPAYIGHLINDSVGPPGSRSPEELEAAWALHNARPVSVYTQVEVAFVATRPIEKGDEILTTYGSCYWANHEALSNIGVQLP